MSTSMGSAVFGEQREMDVAAPSLSAPESPQTLGAAFRVFLQYGSPRFLIVATAVTLAIRFSLAQWTLWDAAVCAALYAYWPVQEWLIHVFILHYEPIRIFGRTIDFAVPSKHRAHHRDPWNIDILFIPVEGFFTSLPLLLLIFVGLMPTHGLAFTGLAFYLLMSLRYEWVHFLVHTRYRPRSAYFKRLWRSHRLHHCKNEKYWFGVTMLGGDRLLGTAPEPTATPLSPTCRTLGIDEAGLR